MVNVRKYPDRKIAVLVFSQNPPGVFVRDERLAKQVLSNFFGVM